jgi:hypothetical protein
MRATGAGHDVVSLRVGLRLVEVIEPSSSVQQFHGPNAQRFVDAEPTPAEELVRGARRIKVGKPAAAMKRNLSVSVHGVIKVGAGVIGANVSCMSTAVMAESPSSTLETIRTGESACWYP